MLLDIRKKFVASLKGFLLSLVAVISFGYYPRYVMPIRFHKRKGAFIKISDDKVSATRVKGYDNGMLFSSRAIGVGEKVKFRITHQSIYEGPIHFGFTSLDPNAISRTILPNFRLLSRQPPPVKAWLHGLSLSEHRSHKPPTDIEFSVSNGGLITYDINGIMAPSNFQLELNKVAVNKPLWACWDLSGCPDGIELLNPSSLLQIEVPPPTLPRILRRLYGDVSFTTSHSNTLQEPGFLRLHSPRGNIRSPIYPANDPSTCVVCYEEDAVLAFIPCGHMCMCQNCIREHLDYARYDGNVEVAQGVLDGRVLTTRGCVICRKPITGVIGPTGQHAS